MRRAILTTALLVAAAIVSPTTAGPEKVNFPSGYKGHVLYATVDRPDNKTVRDLYASPEAARLASPGATAARWHGADDGGVQGESR